MLTPAQIAAVAVDALDDKKAKDIKVLKTDGQTVLADYFVICNGSSAPHIKSLVDEVDRRLDEAPASPRGPALGHLGADGLRLRDRPRLHGRGAQILQSGAPLERRRGC